VTYPEITKLTGVSASTISRWKCRHKWKRPKGAFGRRSVPKDQRAAAERAMATARATPLSTIGWARLR
jgi:uncharacterized protein YjcR